MVGVNELKERFETARAAYPRLRGDVERRVVKWVWATGPFFDVIPGRPELIGVKRGKVIEHTPERMTGLYKYGFDAHQRVVMAIEYSSEAAEASEAWDSVELYEYSGDSVAFWRYSSAQGDDALAVLVGEGDFSQGRLIRDRVMNSYGGWSSEYTYDQDRLVRAQMLQDGKVLSDELTYDRNGTLEAIDRITEAGYRVEFYRRPKRALPKLLAALEKKLLAAIPKAVRKAKLKEPVYCLVLSYDSGALDGMTIPNLALETDRNRAALPAQERSPKCGPLYGNESEFSIQLEIGDDAAMKLSEELTVSYSEAHDEVRGMLLRVAQQLNDLDWKKVAPTTDDFVVVALDLELNYAAAKDVQQSLSPGARTKLVKAGVLK